LQNDRVASANSLSTSIKWRRQDGSPLPALKAPAFVTVVFR
jgi:hypothetical protein